MCPARCCLLALSQWCYAAYWSPSKCLEEAGHFTPSPTSLADTDPDPSPHPLHVSPGFILQSAHKAKLRPFNLSIPFSLLCPRPSAHTQSCSVGQSAEGLHHCLQRWLVPALRHRQIHWVGTEDSLVRPLLTLPSSFPTSTFGFSPCPHLPVKSRMLPPTSLD